MQTSHGTVDTKVVPSIDFRKWQRYYVTFDGLTSDQTVHQNTSISSATTTTAGSNTTTDTKQFSWPLDLTYDFSANPDGSFQQYSKNEVTPTDTLIVDAVTSQPRVRRIPKPINTPIPTARAGTRGIVPLLVY